MNSSNDAKPFPGLPCSAAKLSRTIRENEPAHYVLKIESFSVLSRSGIKQYESEVFQAGDYKWKLLLYPEGNEEDDGQNHISLYLVLADTTGLPTGWNVHVYFTFFVYDHVRNNYITIQAADGKKTRFDAMHTKSGFSKLISLDCFKDTSNGYLYNDLCVFGADVFVTPKCTSMETYLSMIEPPSWNNTYSWVVEKFSTIDSDRLYSKEFKVGNVKWYVLVDRQTLDLYRNKYEKLLLYPKGSLSGKDKYLSIYLGVSDCSSFPLGWKLFAKFKLLVKDQVGDKHIKYETRHWFCDQFYFGFETFMLLSELKEGFLVDDTIIIEAEILAVGTIKNST